MILTLEVVGEQAEDLGASGRKVFHAVGGTIGRLPDNDWVFPDPYVSGRHALIRYLSGKFFVEDTSTNGVFLNSPDNRLQKSQPQVLKDGDLLYIDAYKIQVSIEKSEAGVASENVDTLAMLKGKNAARPAAAVTPAAATPSALPVRPAPAAVRVAPAPPPVSAPAPRSPPRKVPDPQATVFLPPEEDHTVGMGAPANEQKTEWFGISNAPAVDDQKTEWFGTGNVAPPQPESPAPVRPRTPPQRSAATGQASVSKPVPPPPAPAPVPAASPPPAKAPVAARSAPPPVTPTEAPAPAPRERVPERAPARAAGGAHSDDALMKAVLAAAGIVGVEPSLELAQTVGEILRVAVAGLMEVQRARERMKDELRVRGTIFKPAHNNPLKFSANVEDAFHNLLLKHNPAYLDPTDAFKDALHDVRDHHSAILAALRLAFESMLAQFDPNRMQDEFDRQMKKGSILGVPVKLRYWDLYRDKYGDMVKDADTSFRHLFGDKFALEYEEQLERLKSQGRDRER
jgi:type VI secretion system FHA domain protein